MENVIVKIRCGNCGGSWAVNWLDIRDPKANICPKCGAEIDRYLWDRDVINAAASALDCNMELARDAAGYHKTKFSVEFLHRKAR